MKLKFLIVFIIGVAFSLNTHAQSKVFPAGSTVPVVLTENISSKTLKKDAILPLAVAQDIYYNDELAIPQGTPVIAEIVTAKKRKVWGKQGKIGFRLTAIDLNGMRIPISAPDIEKEGHSHKSAANGWFFGTIMFIPLNFIPALCIKGEDAVIEAGGIYNAITQESFSF
ncbi:hypothetical protein [uncultured Muribaculum sp.]|uniref:hypothetical protein n=1 Tax=uncultured Muribaculum sp. TaxID=1918613 RepID=UPI002620C27B|nr:hypothetical protein [uncultured Muribaculum sp.]